jgi:hypothetical protein
MSSTDAIVFGLCALMIAAGIAIMRISHRDRGMGAIGVVLGVIGLLAYLSAEEGAPPPDRATPTVIDAAAPTATPAPRGGAKGTHV